jgi:hypothetical protein
VSIIAGVEEDPEKKMKRANETMPTIAMIITIIVKIVGSVREFRYLAMALP